MGTFRNVRLPDNEALMTAARKALTHPPDSAFSDPGLFVTWGLTIGTHRDDDLLGTSNFERVSEDMLKVFPGDVKSQMSNDWGHGWRDELAVRVIEPWADPDDYTARDVTRAFAVIVAVATYLREQYPLYDESDYSKREYEQRMEQREDDWRSMRHQLWYAYDVDEPSETDRASFDEFYQDLYDNDASYWKWEGDIAEKLMVRQWAGFTADDARNW